MSRRDKALLAAVAGITLVGLGVAALWSSGRDDLEGSSDRMAHIHGLGVDPEDGTLYAGTHHGLFAVPERGQATRVADREQDFMGFTVAGPDHFLASGHPGAGGHGPTSLGLIESTDGGETWRSLSLAGEADFHSLEYRHGQVYGINAMTGQFLVSPDKRRWVNRGMVAMVDFAVSPEEPGVIMATTEHGLARSDDGGKTFALVRDAPLLMLVSWAADSTLVGVGPDGTVYTSADALAWDQRGELDGAPEALEAVSDQEIYAAAGGKIMVSTDGAESFAVRFPR